MSSGSRLEDALGAGKFVATAELGPPRSADMSIIQKKIEILQGHVLAANITDNQTAVVRMSSIASAVKVLEAGLEPIIQMTCRDRNRLAIQADILGAAGLGIRNVRCLTGDHHMFGDHPQARGVFPIDSIQLIQMLRRMRDDKVFQGGAEIRNTKKDPGVEPQLFIGAATNPLADPIELGVARLAKKVRAGAQFIQTQPVFDVERFQEWMKQVREQEIDSKAHILAGVMPVRSYKALNYMNKNVPGITIPQPLVDRMEKAEDGKEEGLQVCVETIESLRKIDGVHGIHIMAVEWEQVVPEIVQRAELQGGAA